MADLLGSKKLILVVDDDEALCQMMALALRTAGFDTITAFDGPSALALYRAKHPHLVVLDFAMPDMNGYEVAAEIRRHEGDQKKTLILFVTAYAQATLVAMDFNISSDGFITKPVLPSELLRHVRELLRD